MNIEEILDMMDETLDKSWNLPLSGGKSVVDAVSYTHLVTPNPIILVWIKDSRVSIPCQEGRPENRPFENTRHGAGGGTTPYIEKEKTKRKASVGGGHMGGKSRR